MAREHLEEESEDIEDDPQEEGFDDDLEEQVQHAEEVVAEGDSLEEVPLDEGGDAAVDVSPFLREALNLFEGVPVASRQSVYWRDNHCFAAFKEQLTNFCDAVVDAMDALPPSPGWRKLSTDDVNVLRSKFLPVYRSFATAKRLLKIAATAAAVRAQGKPSPTHSALIGRFISSYESHGKYEALRAWLYRRTSAYATFRKEYLARPKVRERMAQRRPSPDAERDRKRLAYWKKKGLDAPPKRVGVRREDAIAAQHQERQDAPNSVAAPLAPVAGAEPVVAIVEPPQTQPNTQEANVTDAEFDDVLGNV